MNKKEASALLGKSPRSIADYVAQGRLKVMYIQGKNGKESFFEEEDVQRLKQEIETPTHRGIVAGNESLRQSADSNALGPVRGEVLQRFVEVLEGRNGVPIADKPILKLREAQELTGMPRSVLMDAIRQGKLKADESRWGRGWRMRRTDLDFYISQD